MKKNIKKFLEWTPHDVAEWERIRSKGLPYFIVRHSVVLMGVLFFIFLGGSVALLVWQNDKAAILIPELALIVLICLLGGLINSVISWTIEERNYRKYKKIHTAKSHSHSPNTDSSTNPQPAEKSDV